MKILLEDLYSIARKLIDGNIEPSEAAYEFHRLSCECEYRPLISQIAFIEEIPGFPEEELKLSGKQKAELFGLANQILANFSLDKIEQAAAHINNLRVSLYKVAQEYLENNNNGAVFTACEIYRLARELEEQYLINATFGIVDEVSELPFDPELRKKYHPDLLNRMDKQVEGIECWCKKDVAKICQWIEKRFSKFEASQ